MNSFELNKIMGAVLGACLVLLALNIAADAIFSPEKPAKPGFAIAVQEDKGGAQQAAKEPEQPIEVLLASASAEKGQAAFKPCQACHTVEKGGPSRVGPNLWGVLGKAVASTGGFNYSAALKAKGGHWSYDDLNAFLANPKKAVPGTNMSFAGIARDAQRADLIVYLRSLADAPQPLPTAKK